MNIRVDLNTPIKDGTEVVFRSPVDCSQVTGLKVYYIGEDGNTTSQEFAFADAHGNNVGDIDHLFAENVAVKVILDVTTGMAFVQNADTNAYLEGRFAGLEEGIASGGGVYECIEKICFGYELLTEKPADWDTNKTAYFQVGHSNSKMMPVDSWLSFAPNTYWRYTGEYDTEVSSITRTQEPDGTPYNLKCVMALGHIYNPEKAGLWTGTAYVGGNNSSGKSLSISMTLPKYTATSSGTYPYHMAYKITQEYGLYSMLGYGGPQGGITDVVGASNCSAKAMLKPITDGNITKLEMDIYSAKQYYSEGDYIEIWGVRG